MKKVLLNVALGATALSALPMVASAAPATGNAHGGINTSVQMTVAHPTFKLKSNVASMAVSGMTPAQMRHAYGVDQLSYEGAGQTIAIVDAYGSPTAANDLATFDSQFGLPAANLTVHKMASHISTNGGWALETSLDIEWAHAIAPQANILLVEARSASTTDLLSAIDYATSSGAVVVSNSWGGSETSTESSLDSHFQGNGVVYVASAGDTGGQLEWPAVSPYVLSVGGTTLNVDGSGNYLSESAWSSSGGGLSVYESRPSYQNNVQGVVGTHRGVPDIGMDADPNTGAAVYDSTPDNGQTGWFQVGGTSLSAPMWSALVALADQNRSNKLSNITAVSDLYSMSSSDFHDVTSGSNGNPALNGYDLVTGLGSPVANALIPAWTSAQ